MNATKPDTWDAALYDHRHGFVSRMAGGVVDLLAAAAGERILDVGCGTGTLARRIADAGADVVGVDASAAMVGRARAAHPGLRFDVADATTMAFAEPFDAVFSNAALHWVRPPAAAVDRMWHAVRPGGRLVLEMGGRGNVETILAATIAAGDGLGVDLRDVVRINYFPSVGEYASLLEGRGFAVEVATLFDRPTPLDDGAAGLRNWVRMFRTGVEPRLGDRAGAFYAELERACRPALFRDGAWRADYRRLRVRAVRPGG